MITDFIHFTFEKKYKMILDPLHFSERFENINQILWNKESEFVALHKFPFKTFKKEKIRSHYALFFLNFPLSIENATNDIGVSIFATELLETYYYLVETNFGISHEKEKEIINKREYFDPSEHSETVEYFISRLFDSLIYNYEDFIKNTMKQHYFVGVNDEVKILLSILNRYKSVLKDKTKQIDIFWSIKLNKQISDLILEMLIEFIEQRLNLLTISTESINLNPNLAFVQNDLFSLQWNGSQQELCELILELESKNWIQKIQTGDRRKVATSITKIFNLNGTKKNKRSNPNNSFYQLLKGEHENHQRIYPFMEKEQYKRKFEGILNQKPLTQE